MSFECKIHGKFKRAADKFYRSPMGCPECGRKQQSESIKCTMQDLIDVAIAKNGKCLSKEYVLQTTKYLWGCHNSHEWWAAGNSVIAGRWCPKCVGKSKTTEDFIEQAIKVHGDKYDYSKTTYLTSRKQIIVVCPTHKEFSQVAREHLIYGCNKCRVENGGRTKSLLHEEWVKRAIKIHGDKYEYPEQYTRAIVKIDIVCPQHGIWRQTPHNHLTGFGCKKCASESARKRYQKDIEWLKEIGDKVNVTSLNDTYTNARAHYKWQCNTCSHIWNCSACSINANHGCPICKSSRGERAVNNVLVKYGFKQNIDYNREFQFKDCRNILPLSYDFYIPFLRTAIEFDGQSHFLPMIYFGGEKSLAYNRKMDAIKNNYCLTNNIKLIRIPYWEFKNIESILVKELNLQPQLWH